MIDARASAPASPAAPSVGSDWASRYGADHRLERLTQFPPGVSAPTKIRIYRRRAHFVLQWWDPTAKKTCCCRVDGDLIDALARAREIDQRLSDFRTSGGGVGRLKLEELVDRYVADLEQRANAGEISPATVTRYSNALAYFRRFTSGSAIAKQFPRASLVNRDFRLAFETYLLQLGRPALATPVRPLRSKAFVLDTVRSMFSWAADANRGDLLPAGFLNPFRLVGQHKRRLVGDPFGEPDVTIAMAVDFLEACDQYQLPLFATLMLYGLRASEPIYLFHEQLQGGLFKVGCLPEIDYLTKGRRDKRFPIVPALGALWNADGNSAGLLFKRRHTTRQQFPLLGASLADLAAEYHGRCREATASTAADRQKILRRLIAAAGGLNYDSLEREFQVIARRLSWPRQATLKDFRHLFSTALENAGVGEFYRRYFMGQSPGRTPLATYTHLNQLEIQFGKALANDLAPLVAVVQQRSQLILNQSLLKGA